MTLTTAVNFFETKQGLSFMLSLDNTFLLKNTCDSIATSSDIPILSVCAALLHNFILFSPNITAISFLVNIIIKRIEVLTIKEEESLYRFLKAIGHAIEKGNEAKQQIQKFDFGKINVESQRVKDIVAEIQELLA